MSGCWALGEGGAQLLAVGDGERDLDVCRFEGRGERDVVDVKLCQSLLNLWMRV